MPSIIEMPHLHNKIHVFAHREEAGQLLAQQLGPVDPQETMVWAIPAGGVPVAIPIAQRHGLPLDLLIVRKVQIPWNLEAGFGAVGPGADVIFNERLLTRLHLSQEEVDRQVERTKDNMAQREIAFRQGRPYPYMQGKTVIVVDDGLASGYTMLAALAFLRKQNTGRILVAVPTGLLSTVQTVASHTDTVICLNIRERTPFAVAEAYVNWYDVEDAEVLHLLDIVNQNPQGNHG